MERVLRVSACAIAALALIDPVITSTRPVRSVVSLIAASAPTDADRTLMERVAGVLDTRFVVVRGLAADAVAVVAVGDTIHDDAERVAVPTFAVLPQSHNQNVSIAALRGPWRGPVESRVPLVATVRVTGAPGATLNVTLTAGGVMVDRVTRIVSSSAAYIEIPVSLVAATEGLVAARVTATVVGSNSPSASAAADTAVRIDRRAWRVLVFDPRPSWMSTFVRRALEKDPRFVVTNRTITSTRAWTGTADAPATLADAGALSRFDAIVVGAPDGLNEADVGGIEGYLRRRVVAVVLLLDSTKASSGVDRLLGVDRWSDDTGAKPFDLRPSSTEEVVVRASELRWPTPPPVGASALALSDKTSSPVIWQAPVGAGRVVVSGALDAWRYRTIGATVVDRFWRQMVASAAEASPPPIEIRFDKNVVASAERVRARVVLNAVALNAGQSPATAEVTGTITGPTGASPVRLWPDGIPGQFVALLSPSSAVGTYRLSVTSGNERADAEWFVAPAPRAAVPIGRDLLQAWTASRGGAVVSEADLGGLIAAIDRNAPPVRRDERWHPMRHPLWIAPFALLLGAEWWLRRKRGCA